MSARSLLLGAALLPALALPASADTLRDAVAKDMGSLMAIYRDLHSNPELSFQETRSAAKLVAEAKKLGFEVATGIGKTGVVAVLKNGPGPVVLLRADMDGLPVAEQTGLAFASKAKGRTEDGVDSAIMHACGHDTHMSSWIGAARRLVELKKEWSGTLVMIGQPAEEIGKGAKAMLDDGLYTRFPKPSRVIAFHDSASLPAGTIGIKPGYALANVDSVDLTVKGVGGHGAYPHTTKDPIVLAARIVTAVQTLVSREVEPQQPSVVTAGSIHGGTKHNIIPDQVEVQFTVRSYTDETRRLLLDGIARIARGEAIAAGVPDDRMPVVVVRDGFTPATFNTEPATSRLIAEFEKSFGKERVVAAAAVMGGEDFSQFYLADKSSIQSTIFWVGGVPQEKWDAAKGDTTKLPSLHSATWAPDAEKVIATATEAMTRAALLAFGQK